MNVAVLIPAHNESERIADTVTASFGITGVTDVLVVDDGSMDDTGALAQSAGARVVKLEGNQGKGGALEVGANALSEMDVLLLLDADLGKAAAQGELLLAPVLCGEADMVIAKFPRPANKAGFGLVKGLARNTIKDLGGGFLADAPLSGQRALTKECLGAVRPFADGYGVEVALTVRALQANMRVTEVETTMTHAATGRDVAGFLHRGKQFVDVLVTSLALRFKRYTR